MDDDEFDWMAATREARDAFVVLLKQLAPVHATGSRDFGRGFAHAIRTLQGLAVDCAECPLDRATLIGQTWKCPKCPVLWQRMTADSWRVVSRD